MPFNRLKRDPSFENDPVAQGPKGSNSPTDPFAESLEAFVTLSYASTFTKIDPFTSDWIDTKHNELFITYKPTLGIGDTPSQTKGDKEAQSTSAKVFQIEVKCQMKGTPQLDFKYNLCHI